MKISIVEIGGYKLLDKQYLSDSIIRFKIDAKRQFSEKMWGLQELFSDPSAYAKCQHMVEALNYQTMGTPYELMSLDLKHLLDADFYYTNGQEVFSLVKGPKGWQIGQIKSMFHFGNSLYLFHPLDSFRLTSLEMPEFRMFESAEFYVIQQLQQLKITRLPLDNDTEITLQEFYPESVLVSFAHNRYNIFNTMFLDHTSRDIEKDTFPHRLRTCLNCRSFQFSGMSQDMSSGTKGYCIFIKEELRDQFASESVTHIWNWCSRFEAREKISNRR